jgi:hypothetical protein
MNDDVGRELLTRLDKLVTHFLSKEEGSQDPEPTIKHEGFRRPVRAWQDTKTSLLHVTTTGPSGTYSVDVVFEGEESKTTHAEEKIEADEKDPLKVFEGDLTFGLPDPWKSKVGARFVTINAIYTDSKKKADTKLSHILPAPVGNSDTRRYDRIEGSEDDEE